MASGNPTRMLDATVSGLLRDLTETVTQEFRDAAVPEMIEALNVLVAVHWIRCQLLHRGQYEEIYACLKWSAALLPVAPHLVPEPVRAYLSGPDHRPPQPPPLLRPPTAG